MLNHLHTATALVSDHQRRLASEARSRRLGRIARRARDRCRPTHTAA